MVYRFYCMALFHSQTRRHVIKERKHLNIFGNGYKVKICDKIISNFDE